MQDLHRLFDKQQICEVIHRYCRGVDRLDTVLISSAYHPDAWDDHGTFKARGVDCAELIVDRVRRQSTSSMHCISNVIIELDGDRAETEAYFVAWLAFDRGTVSFIRALGGRYIDTFEKREGSWKIARRAVVHEWSRIDPIVERWPPGKNMHQGQRSRLDVSYGGPVIDRAIFNSPIYGEKKVDGPRMNDGP